MNISTPTEDGFTYEVFEKANDIIAVVAFMASGIACASTVSYLNTVPTVKNCLLLFLYKDTVLSIVWFIAIRLMKTLFSYVNKGIATKAIALTISFAFWGVLFYGALILLLTSIYKLCMAKTKSVDPKIPFLGEDEQCAIWKTRIACILTVLGCLSTTFSMGWYPGTFYLMMPDQEPKTNLMLSNMIYRGAMIFLIMVSCGLTIVEKYYNTTIELTMDRIVSKSMKYVAILTVIALVCLCVAEAFPSVSYKNKWEITQLTISLTIIIGPFALISRSDQLKSHSIQLYKKIYDDTFLLIIYIGPLCLSILIIVCMFVIF